MAANNEIKSNDEMKSLRERIGFLETYLFSEASLGNEEGTLF